MNPKLIKCIITRYDKTITEPPYQTKQIDTIEFEKPIDDKYGIEFFTRLTNICKEKGYKIKFYRFSSKLGIDYEVVVY